MPTHPGHPAIASSTKVSDSRALIADALDAVSIQTLSTTSTIGVDSGRIVLGDATGGAVVLSLPDPEDDARNASIRMTVKKSDSSGNSVTVNVANSGTIDGAASVVLAAQFDAVTVFNDGTDGNWFIESSV